MTDTGTDRENIRDLCARYAIALGEHDWAALSEVFAEGAVMTFAHIGDVTGAEGIAETCGGALEKLDASQHLIGTVLPVVDGDRAGARATLRPSTSRACLLMAGAR